MISINNIRNNQILAALSESELKRLVPYLQKINLSRGTILFEPQETIKLSYLPISCMISLVSIMENGATTEIGLIGNEGIIGLPIILGGVSSTSQAVVQISGECWKLPAEILKREFTMGLTLQKVLLLHLQARLTQVSQSAACNRQHKITARLAKWILSVRDTIQQDDIPLTQELIAQMLGVRRAGVSTAANQLQQLGIIRYHRGSITILDNDKLEETACECYLLVRNELIRLSQISQRQK